MSFLNSGNKSFKEKSNVFCLFQAKLKQKGLHIIFYPIYFKAAIYTLNQKSVAIFGAISE